MHQTATKTATVTLDSSVDVECTQCGITMTSHVGSGGRVRYFHCPSCHRWSSSVYTEVFRADTKMRTRASAPSARPVFGSAGERLRAWLRSLDTTDPWRELGVSPLDPESVIRERYRELARLHHPDRGGDPIKMQRLNEAYERVLTHREERRREALAAGTHAAAAAAAH